MPTPSTEIVQLLACFASAMTAPSFSNALVLLYGSPDGKHLCFSYLDGIYVLDLPDLDTPH